MVTVIDMTTGRLIHRSSGPETSPTAATRERCNHPQPGLQNITVEAESSAPAMPPELAEVCPDEFMDRWQK